MFINKRLLIIVGVAMVILLGATGFGLAFAFSHMYQASTTSNTPTVTPSVTSLKAVNKICVQGIIKSLGSQSFMVSENQGKKTVTVNVDGQTTFAKRGGQVSLAFSDLIVGDKVRVNVQGQCGKQDLTVLAQRVIVLPAAGSPTPTASPTAANG